MFLLRSSNFWRCFFLKKNINTPNTIKPTKTQNLVSKVPQRSYTSKADVAATTNHNISTNLKALLIFYRYLSGYFTDCIIIKTLISFKAFSHNYFFTRGNFYKYLRVNFLSFLVPVQLFSI